MGLRAGGQWSAADRRCDPMGARCCLAESPLGGLRHACVPSGACVDDDGAPLARDAGPERVKVDEHVVQFWRDPLGLVGKYFTKRGRAELEAEAERAAIEVWWLLTGELPASREALDVVRHGYAMDQGEGPHDDHAALTRDLLETAVGVSPKSGQRDHPVSASAGCGARRFVRRPRPGSSTRSQRYSIRSLGLRPNRRSAAVVPSARWIT